LETKRVFKYAYRESERGNLKQMDLHPFIIFYYLKKPVMKFDPGLAYSSASYIYMHAAPSMEILWWKSNLGIILAL
jgi:hypothetical protein